VQTTVALLQRPLISAAPLQKMQRRVSSGSSVMSIPGNFLMHKDEYSCIRQTTPVIGKVPIILSFQARLLLTSSRERVTAERERELQNESGHV